MLIENLNTEYGKMDLYTISYSEDCVSYGVIGAIFIGYKIKDSSEPKTYECDAVIKTHIQEIKRRPEIFNFPYIDYINIPEYKLKDKIDRIIIHAVYLVRDELNTIWGIELPNNQDNCSYNDIRKAFRDKGLIIQHIVNSKFDINRYTRFR